MEDFTDGGSPASPNFSAVIAEVRAGVRCLMTASLVFFALLFAWAEKTSSPEHPVIVWIILFGVTWGLLMERVLTRHILKVCALQHPVPSLETVLTPLPATKPTHRYCKKHEAYLGKGRHYCGYCSEEDNLLLLKECRRFLPRGSCLEKKEFISRLSNELVILSLRHPCCKTHK